MIDPDNAVDVKSETSASGEPSPAPGRFGPRSIGRRAAVVLCAALSILFLVLGVTGFWLLRTAANDDWTRRQVEATLRDPAVSDALAAKLVEEFDAEIDLDARIRSLLPDRLDAAAPVLAQAALTQIQERVSEALRSDVAVDVASRAVAGAQRSAFALLNGDGTVEGVDLETGEVRLNLLPLIPRVIEAGQRIGLFADITAPDLEGLSRDEQLAALSQTLDRPLPDTFANPVVFRSDALKEAGNTLETVRRVVLWTRALFWLLLLLGVAFAVGAVLLSRNRLRTGAWWLGALVGSILLVRLVMGRAVSQLPNITDNAGGRAAIGQVANNALGSLTTWFVWLAIITMIAVGAVYALVKRPWAPHDAA